MAEIEDFDDWISNLKIVEPTYEAVFDIKTGDVLSVGPSHAYVNEKYKVSLDRDTAEKIIDGTLKIHDCWVNLQTKILERPGTKTVYKIDDVLHRIPDKKWTKKKDFEIYITYNTKKKSLKFELTSEYGGSKKSKFKKKRVNAWAGDTNMRFFITDYNDPNIFYQAIDLSVANLMEYGIVVNKLHKLPEKFSIFTRRLFENYVIEYK